MGDHTAFFYGTLMAPGVLHRVIYGSSKPETWQKELTSVRPALLRDFERHRVAHADYPAILPKPGATVRGSVVTGLTDGDIFRLDIFEGDQYARKKVKVQVLKDVGLAEAAAAETIAHAETNAEFVEAETYVWIESADLLEPREWDFAEFQRDKMKAWMGEADADPGTEVDEGFADVDRAVAEEESRLREKKDPMGGRGANGHITKQLEETRV